MIPFEPYTSDSLSNSLYGDDNWVLQKVLSTDIMCGVIQSVYFTCCTSATYSKMYDILSYWIQ